MTGGDLVSETRGIGGVGAGVPNCDTTQEIFASGSARVTINSRRQLVSRAGAIRITK